MELLSHKSQQFQWARHGMACFCNRKAKNSLLFDASSMVLIVEDHSCMVSGSIIQIVDAPVVETFSERRLNGEWEINLY